MKKFYFFIAITIFASLLLISCVDNVFVLAKENISEIRNNILIYEDEECNISFMSGKREHSYILDGITTENINFSIITVNNLTNNKYNKISFSTIINDKEYSGELIQNPYDNTFVTDLQIFADDLTTLELTIFFDDITKNYTLTKINTDWKVSNLDALEIMCKDLNNEIKPFIINNKLSAETYIKLVYNKEYSADYYWYINIITTTGESFTEIINPINGDILAKNITN